MNSKRLLVVTTVPQTFFSILKGQPGWLGKYFDVGVVSSGDSIFDFSVDEGVRGYSVPMRRGISPVQDVVSIFRMILLIRNVRPDVVHSYTPKAGLVAMVAAFFCRVPIRVHTFTGLIFPTQLGVKQKILIWIDRLICWCATKVVPEGEGVKKDLLAYRVTKKRLEVIGFGNIAGVDTSYFCPSGYRASRTELLERFEISSDSFVFCFVGRLNRDKGIKELVSAFMTLPDSACLLLVGGADETAPVDSATLSVIESNPRIHVTGHLDDIRPALACSDVMVLPSYREGFPNVVLQAGAMSLPVIATDINGNNEVVEPGFNGWLVPVRDSKRLGEAMSSAMQKSGMVLNSMGERARLRIQGRFERKEHWQRMLDFYRELIK